MQLDTPTFSSAQLLKIAVACGCPAASTYFLDDEYVIPTVASIQKASRAIIRGLRAKEYFPPRPNAKDCDNFARSVASLLSETHAHHYPECHALPVGFWVGIGEDGSHVANLGFTPPAPGSELPSLTFFEPQTSMSVCAPPQTIYLVLF